MDFQTNASNLILRVRLKNDANVRITGIAFNDPDLAVSYSLESNSVWVTPSLVAGTLGTYIANSWVEIGNGLYQYCPPNAAIVANTCSLIRVVYGANEAEECAINARLPVAVGSAAFTPVVVARVPIGSAVGWPQELVIGDAYLTATATAPPLFIKDIDDNILDAMGTKNFDDADFVGTLRFSPLTTTTRELDSPPTTIEVDSADSPGIVFNDDTPGAEFFELQIPHAKTALGVIKTRYSAQFILNWGATREFERTINLGEIKFIRKNAPA